MQYLDKMTSSFNIVDLLQSSRLNMCLYVLMGGEAPLGIAHCIVEAKNIADIPSLYE